jgi:Protein of unknown function DUF262
MYDITANPHKMSKVNLDALIPKADFIAEGTSDKKNSKLDAIYLFHLAKNNDFSIYHLLKKPDFQRETNEWDTKRIADLVDCFINGGFIPSIILWENQETGLIYVIDGAHRLSALISYINNDYGYGSISHEFNRYAGIADSDKDLAKQTEDYINKTIGSYQDVISSGGAKADGLKRGHFDVQIITGNVKIAEESFFKINAQGVVLTPTEKALCKAREYPSCIATRVIMKGMSSHQYTKNFHADNQKNVTDVGVEVNTLLFTPPYNEEAKSTILHHPLGGSPTNGMPMVFELMKLINVKYKNGKTEEKDVMNGSETFDYLVWTRKLIWKLLSEKPGSLGLYPSLYFYNTGGKFIHSAFLGMAQLLIDNDGNNETPLLIKFTKVRGNLELFLIKYKVFLGQINAKFGSKQRSYRHLKGFFMTLIDLFDTEYPSKFEVAEPTILKEIKNIYPFLNERDMEVESKSSKFSKEIKTFLRIKTELESTSTCSICGGLLHPFSIDYDHKKDQKFNGGSDIKNAQQTHIYCNNSKDLLINLGIYVPDKI